MKPDATADHLYRGPEVMILFRLARGPHPLPINKHGLLHLAKAVGDAKPRLDTVHQHTVTGSLWDDSFHRGRPYPVDGDETAGPNHRGESGPDSGDDSLGDQNGESDSSPDQ